MKRVLLVVMVANDAGSEGWVTMRSVVTLQDRAVACSALVAASARDKNALTNMQKDSAIWKRARHVS